MAIGIALLGHGNIGKEVNRVINERYKDLVEIKKILIRDPYVHPCIPQSMITTPSSFDADILGDEQIKIIVELIGGDTDARDYIARALKAGKHVVTANKAVISQYGHEIIPLASKHSCSIRFDAAVGGGIPLIRVMDQLRHGQIRLIAGILNGTCNSILTEMERKNYTFKEALAKAQNDGLAEPDPTLDIDGTDTCQKISILATLAFGALIKPDQVPCQGISGQGWEIISADLQYFSQMGYSVKLLGLARRYGAEVEVRVAPVLVKKDHRLAFAVENYNELMVDGDFKDQGFFGIGAGPKPTAVSVASGISDIATSLQDGRPVWGLREYGGSTNLKLRDMNQVMTRGYIRSLSPDKLGVFEQKFSVLREEEISVQGSKNWQEKVENTVDMPDYIEISPTQEHRIHRAIEKMSRLKDVVTGMPAYFRIEEHL